MQTEEALERAAFELCEDAANEQVVYIEIRFAPLLHSFICGCTKQRCPDVPRGFLYPPCDTYSYGSADRDTDEVAEQAEEGASNV